MLLKFRGKLPATRIFSEYARSTLKDINPQEDQDLVLMAWMEREETLFRISLLVPKLQLGNLDGEALALLYRKLELPVLNSQAGAWEIALNCGVFLSPL
jgi:hypothetical protein